MGQALPATAGVPEWQQLVVLWRQAASWIDFSFNRIKMANKEALLVALRKGRAEKVIRIIKTNDELTPDTEADSARNCLLHR